MAKEQLKRENFEVTPEQEQQIDCLRSLTNVRSRKDAILLAINLALQVAGESRCGNKFFIGNEHGKNLRQLVILGLQPPSVWPWKYLVEIAHPWKKQLFVKGRKLPAAGVWTDMIVNQLSREAAADNWELPIEAIDEIIAYCEANKQLLQMEAAEEGRRLTERGIQIEPATTVG